MVGCCEGRNGPSSYIKCRESIDKLRNCKLMKKDSAL
jgi:hypothetical protein